MSYNCPLITGQYRILQNSVKTEISWKLARKRLGLKFRIRCKTVISIHDKRIFDYIETDGMMVYNVTLTLYNLNYHLLLLLLLLL